MMNIKVYNSIYPYITVYKSSQQLVFSSILLSFPGHRLTWLLECAARQLPLHPTGGRQVEAHRSAGHRDAASAKLGACDDVDSGGHGGWHLPGTSALVV